MDPKRNFKNYREAMATCAAKKITCVPFLGIVLTDFTFLDDGNPDMEEDDFINWQKVRLINREIQKLSETVRIPYDISFDEKVHNFLTSTEIWNENDVFRLSKLREKKSSADDPSATRKKKQKKIDRMTNFLLMDAKERTLEPSPLTERDWKLVMGHAKEVRYNRGGIILEERAPNHFLFRIKEGSVVVRKISRTDQQRESRGDINQRPAWVPDDLISSCQLCKDEFTFFRRRHHCRHCGQIFCGQCSAQRHIIERLLYMKPVRVCNTCAVLLKPTAEDSSFRPKTIRRLEVGDIFGEISILSLSGTTR